LAYISLAVEGVSDEAVAKRLCLLCKHEVVASYVKGGKTELDRNLHRYNAAARFEPWVALRDLNGDAPCAPALVAKLLPEREPEMLLRVPVRSVEAWVLGDGPQLAKYLKVRLGEIPTQPESLHRPKRSLVDLARRSRDGRVVDDMVPREGSGREVGPGYNARLIDFVVNRWRPDEAAKNAPSLESCLHALSRLK
jgi:hypothetical protein